MGRRNIIRCSIQELKEILLGPAGGKFLRPYNGYDQVYPGILIGDVDTALSTLLLREIGVTHVLNAAQGKNDKYYGGFVNTKESYYKSAGIHFMGIPALDFSSFYLKPFFEDAADFIDEALRNGGTAFVHCQCGISRSATLAAAYLMIKKGFTVQKALATIREKRSIYPNDGFLSQLCDLDYELRIEARNEARDIIARSVRSSSAHTTIGRDMAPTKTIPVASFYPLPLTQKLYNKTRNTVLRSTYGVSAYSEIDSLKRRAKSEERLDVVNANIKLSSATSYRDLTPLPRIIPQSLDSSQASKKYYATKITPIDSHGDIYIASRKPYRVLSALDDYPQKPIWHSKRCSSTDDLQNTNPRYVRASSVASFPSKLQSLKERSYTPLRSHTPSRSLEVLNTPVEIKVYDKPSYEIKYSRYAPETSSRYSRLDSTSKVSNYPHIDRFRA